MISWYLVTIFFFGLNDHQKVFIGLLLQFIKLVSSCSQQIMLTSQTTMRWWFSLIRKIVEEFAMTTLRQRAISLLLTNSRTSEEMDETLQIGNFHLGATATLNTLWFYINSIFVKLQENNLLLRHVKHNIMVKKVHLRVT